MTNTKRRTGKFIIIGVVLITLLTVLAANVFITKSNRFSAHAALLDSGDDIAYMRHVPTLADDFVANKVIVTLKPDYSEVNKNINIQNFRTSKVITSQCADVEYFCRQSEAFEDSVSSDIIIIESAEDLTHMLNPSKIVNRATFTQIVSLELREDSKENVLKVISELEKLDMVLAAEPSYNMVAEDLWSPPNDTDYSKQWGLGSAPGIRAQGAWAFTTGDVNPRVKVGIFETNLQANHPDLRIIPGSFAGSGSQDHGTHVAGIIGAIGNNNRGITGVAQAEVALLDRGPAGAADRPQFIDSLVWAIDNGVRIANASFRFLLDGGNAPWTVAHREGIRMFGENGGLFIAAAGNEANNNDNNVGVSFPAGYSDSRFFPELTNMISVGSIDSNGIRSSFSNFGVNSVQIYAPGGMIWSTLPGSTYGNMSGTSMAAPHVAGVAALLLSVNPNLTVAQLRGAILNNADAITISVPGGGTQNALRLNATTSVQSVAPTPLTTRAFDNFGYNGSTYYWNGKVDVTVANGSLVDQISSNTMTLSGDTMLDFKLSTASSKNSWSTINGTVSFQLTLDSTGAVIPIQGNETHISTVNVNIFNNVTLGNTTFRINTADFSLPGTHSYTLTLISDLNRASWNDTDTKTFNIVIENPPLCVAEGTLVTLADGSQKPVELLTMDDMLLVWNYHTGNFDVAPMVFIDSDSNNEYEIIHLHFSDGSEVKVIHEHAFWSATLNQYVFIRNGESMQYIGDWFNKQTTDENGNMIWQNVQLVDVQIYKEQTTAWSPVTFAHLNFYVNGMLSMPGATEGLINIFDVDSLTMQYDMDAMQRDVDKYGLFTYDEFFDIIPIPEIIFEAFNGQYLKISIGKGLIDLEMLVGLIERYANFF